MLFYTLGYSYVIILQSRRVSMSRKRSKEKNLQKQIASERIIKLLEMAESHALEGNMMLANRYVELSRKLSMRYLVPIPAAYKRCFCKHCYSYLLPGVSSRVRISRGRLITSCFQCQKQMRRPLKHN